MPIVNSCCCGCDLRTGTIIILICAIFGLAGSQAAMKYMLLALAHIPYGYELFEVLLLGYFICACIGIYAAVVRRGTLLVPILITHAILLLFMVMSGLILLMNYGGFNEGSKNNVQYTLGTLILNIVLQGYFGIVMYSYYQELTGR